MMIRNIKKRPTATLVMIALVFVGIALGNWQLKRAAQKEQIAQELIEKEKVYPLVANEKMWHLAEALHHKMSAKGIFLESEAIWLENRPHPLGQDPHTGIATGFFLMMPFRLSGESGVVIWVNRGWVPRNFQNLNEVPPVITPKKEVEIHGLVFEGPSKTYQMGADLNSKASDGLALQENLNLELEGQRHQWEQLPFILREDDLDIQDGLQRTWAPMDHGAEKNFGYAFQWFALSLMSFVFWLVSGFRSKP